MIPSDLDPSKPPWKKPIEYLASERPGVLYWWVHAAPDDQPEGTHTVIYSTGARI